jgi:hypothetical protein
MVGSLALVLLVFCSTVAQTSPKNSEPTKNREASGKVDQWNFAIQLVSSLADDARNFKDDALKVQVQARVADVLWNVDRVRARALFERAWEAAEVVDVEGRRQADAERKRFLSGRGGTGFIPSPPNLRGEVLRLASMHDRALAEAFLTKIDEADKREDGERNSKPWNPTEPPEALARRLQLARQLLESGELDKALLVATPGLSQITSPGIIFLVLLRQKSASRADQMFRSLLEITANNPAADATSISLLSSYVFTPSTLVTVTRSGLLMNPWNDSISPPDLPPNLKALFFTVAAQVLLRPLSRQDLEATSAGLNGTYFTIKRLLPLFEQNSPDQAAALQARLNALSEGTGDLIPEQQRSFVNAGFNSSADETIDWAERINHAPNTNERNRLNALAAREAADKNDPKALEFADRIEDSELRTRVRGYVDLILLSKVLEKKNWEAALKLARNAQLTYFQRSWVYSELVGMTEKSAPDQAVQLITDATVQAEHIEPATAESAQAWIAIASRTGAMDQNRKWQAASDAVKAVDKVTSTYTGEESDLLVRLQIRNDIATIRIPAPTTALAALFKGLAEEDVYRAAELAKSIGNEGPRAVAILATARYIFQRKTK